MTTTLQYYTTDHLGSRKSIFTENGTIIKNIDYSIWGESTDEDASFTGKELDSTGLYYFNARYYDPLTCRFVTEDPGKKGLSWYTYCSNDPINRIDRNGKEDYIAAAEKDTWYNNFFKWIGINTYKLFGEVDGGMAPVWHADSFIGIFGGNSFGHIEYWNVPPATMQERGNLAIFNAAMLTLPYSVPKNQIKFAIGESIIGSENLLKYSGGDLSVYYQTEFRFGSINNPIDSSFGWHKGVELLAINSEFASKLSGKPLTHEGMVKWNLFHVGTASLEAFTPKGLVLEGQEITSGFCWGISGEDQLHAAFGAMDDCVGGLHLELNTGKGARTFNLRAYVPSPNGGMLFGPLELKQNTYTSIAKDYLDALRLEKTLPK